MPKKVSPDVTVVITSYNNGPYLRQTIDSVLSQTGLDFELFVFDDCSTDNSIEIIKTYENDPRFNYKVNRKNLGAIGNFNNCIEAGTGKYIAVLSSDDFFYPGHLLSLYAALESHPNSSIGYTQCCCVDEFSRVIKVADHPGHPSTSYFGGRDEVVDLLRFDNYITPSAAMIRRSVLDRIRLPSGEVHQPDMLAGDWELWIRIARSFPDFVFLRQATVGYRIHGSQVSQRFYGSVKPLLEHIEILNQEIDDRASFSRILAKRNDIWALLQSRIFSYPQEIQTRYEDLIEAVHRRLFDQNPPRNNTLHLNELHGQARGIRPLVSVVMPTFNRPHMLRDALDSVCKQTYTNWEAIVVNDAGRNVADVISQFPAHFKIRLINHESNKGLPAARNTALSVAQGEIICYLDDDDLFKPEHLSTVVVALQDPSVSFVYVQAEHVTEQLADTDRLVVERKPYSTGQPQTVLLAQNFVPVNTWAHRRSCVEQVGYFDETLKTHEDWELLIRLSLAFQLVNVPRTTVEVRERVVTDNMLRTIRLLDTFDLIYKRYPVDDPILLAARHRMRAHVANRDRLIPRNGIFPHSWNEIEYLRLNPDVAELVNKQALDSGYSHFLAYGQFENRPGVPLSMLERAETVAPRASAPALATPYMKLIEASRPDAGSLWQAASRTIYGASSIDVVIVSQESSTAVETTLSTLAAQVLPANQVLQQPDLDAWLGLAHSTRGDWTLLLCAGDSLEPDALLLLERAIHMQANTDTRVVYFDHDEVDGDAGFKNPCLKPDFNLDLLLSLPYMGRALVVRTAWAKEALSTSARHVLSLNTTYHLTLQALRETGAKAFVHVPVVLAHLSPDNPTIYATTSETWQELATTLEAHLQATASGVQILEGPGPGTFHRLYPLAHTPLVSIIIPTRDQVQFLSRCIESLVERTAYSNFEIIVIDNDSQTPEARDYLLGLSQIDPQRIRVLTAPGPFNFSRMNNQAAREAQGELLLLLNNDTAALQADWLEHMVRNALREEVGIVGARLVYPDGRLQHAGVIMGLRGPAEHPCLGLQPNEPGYMFRAQLQQNFSAVTAACLLVSKGLYDAVGGLDEESFGVSYNDVDFCLRVGQTGRLIVWTPLATLLHEGSASQKASIEATSTEAKVARFSREQAAMYQRWPEAIANDPAYNPNLSLAERGYELETNPVLRYNKLLGSTEKRVLAFAADDHGCGHYRIIQPIRAMLDAGLCSGGTSPEILWPNLALRSGANTLVFQRPIDDRALDALEALLPLKNVRKVFEVDDDITRIPLKSAHREHMPKDLRRRIGKALSRCDRLVVSTEALAHELRGKCAETRVVVNRLPPAMWGDAPLARLPLQRAGKPKVGWAGGVGHQGDLEMIGDVIKGLADQVDWVFFGMCPDAIRPYVREVHEGVPTLDYPKRLMELARDWDLAIAPLEVNAFNECKSNLKLLEYGWCGLPVVCSDITPYQGDWPATRVKNRYKDWGDAILSHISDRDASARMGLDLQDRVASNWTLTGSNLQDWYHAWTD